VRVRALPSTYHQWYATSQNLWIKHICLNPGDLHSDPPHIKVRAIQGKEAVTYLDPGLLTGSLSYVRSAYNFFISLLFSFSN
jgi:hypothetical protein